MPVLAAQPMVEELNRFLRGHRVLSVERRLIEEGRNSMRSFCVEYPDGAVTAFPVGLRVDYKEVLSPEQFAVFSRLRTVRKEIADKESVPAYAVFTND